MQPALVKVIRPAIADVADVGLVVPDQGDNRGGAHAPQYVLRIDRLPIQTTTNRKLALVMGRFTAEDAVKSMQNSHCNPELVSVRVGA